MTTRNFFFAFFALAWGVPDLPASDCKRAIERCVRSLDSCRVVCATKGNQNSLISGKPSDEVVFLEAWFNGDGAQFRHVIVDGRSNEGDWWDGFVSSGEPLTSATVGEFPGLVSCARSKGENGYTEFRQVSDTKGFTLFSKVRKEPDLLQQLYLPLVSSNRSWVPVRQNGAFLAIDLLAKLPDSAWGFVADEMLSGVPVSVYNVVKSPPVELPLKRHSGSLKVTWVYRVWCSKECYMPLRIESRAEIEYGGKNYDYRNPPGQPSSLMVFEADDYREFSERSWYPYSGMECTYEPAADPEYDPDKIVDKILADGFYEDESKLLLATKRRWKILSLAESSYRSDLWIDPPTGCLVHNADTDERFLAGMSKEESAKRMSAKSFGDQSDSRQGSKNRGSGSLFPLLIGTIVLVCMFFMLRKRS